MINILAFGGTVSSSVKDSGVVWIDLENPSEEEEAQVEAAFAIDVPTAAEREAFEESARFYEENGALYLTATLLGRRDDGPFVSGTVTFILVHRRLVTVREIRPRAFSIGRGRASARIHASETGGQVAFALVEGSIERLADLLAELSGEANTLASHLFTEEIQVKGLREGLKLLGRIVVLTALAHESLASLQRLTAFAIANGERHDLNIANLTVLSRDIAELEGVAGALQARASYMQDAVLGIVNAKQTEVLKALSIAAIAFIPPTLVASVFGMNFEAMSWFQASWGPWVAFGLMLLAPASLFALAKWRDWFG